MASDMLRFVEILEEFVVHRTDKDGELQGWIPENLDTVKACLKIDASQGSLRAKRLSRPDRCGLMVSRKNEVWCKFLGGFADGTQTSEECWASLAESEDQLDCSSLLAGGG